MTEIKKFIMEAQIIEEINKNKIEFIQMELVDVNGISRSVIADSQHFIRNYKSGIQASVAALSFQITGELILDTGFIFDVDAIKTSQVPDLDTFQVKFKISYRPFLCRPLLCHSSMSNYS